MFGEQDAIEKEASRHWSADLAKQVSFGLSSTRSSQVIFFVGRAHYLQPMSDAEFRKWCKKKRHELKLPRLRERDDETDS